MKLGFRERHLSITAFPDVEIPPLTIILGINGSGKSHLLQAIANGQTTNDIVPTDQHRMAAQPNAHGGIRLLQSGQAIAMDPNSYQPAPANSGQPGGIHPGSNFDRMRQVILQPFFDKLENLTAGRVSQSLLVGDDVWRLGIAEIVRRVGDESLEPAVSAIFGEAAAAMPRAREQAANNPSMAGPSTELLVESPQIAAKLGVSVFDLTVGR